MELYRESLKRGKAFLRSNKQQQREGEHFGMYESSSLKKNLHKRIGSENKSDVFTIGTWFSYEKPKWETNLEWCSEEIIDKTGLSRERLKKVLEVLYENRIIE